MEYPGMDCVVPRSPFCTSSFEIKAWVAVDSASRFRLPVLLPVRGVRDVFRAGEFVHCQHSVDTHCWLMITSFQWSSFFYLNAMPYCRSRSHQTPLPWSQLE